MSRRAVSSRTRCPVVRMKRTVNTSTPVADSTVIDKPIQSAYCETRQPHERGTGPGRQPAPSQLRIVTRRRAGWHRRTRQRHPRNRTPRIQRRIGRRPRCNRDWALDAPCLRSSSTRSGHRIPRSDGEPRRIPDRRRSGRSRNRSNLPTPRRNARPARDRGPRTRR